MRAPAQANIIDRLPHRPPFLFLSGIDELQPGVCGRGTWEVGADAPFLAGHFPGRPVVPGVIIAEALAQLCGLVGLGGPQSDAAITPQASLAHVDLRFRGPIAPPATIRLQCALVRRLGNLLLFDVRAWTEQIVAARGRLTLAGSGAAED